jgi:hypothetical protein
MTTPANTVTDSFSIMGTQWKKRKNPGSTSENGVSTIEPYSSLLVIPAAKKGRWATLFTHSMI